MRRAGAASPGPTTAGTGASPLPPVVGHRGAKGAAPENTLAGFRAAAALGATWVEFDVRLTRDGRAVLLHDADLARTTGRAGALADATLAEIGKLDAGAWFGPGFAGEPVPTLAQALRLIADLGLGANIEIKADPGRETPVVEAVAADVDKAWPATAPSPLVSSYDTAIVGEVGRRMPALPRAWIARRLPRGWMERVRPLDCASIHLGARSLDEAAIAEVKGAGYGLGVFTVNDAAKARKLWRSGVDTVFTDRPDVVLAAHDDL